ncbi:putative small secreted protein [Kibdelosporangium banguiense]|uniref:Small secreted protein n=1 Tax=Kibdelosporangium banguiense TaxID=1365924 RepID=A0ABS4TS44_9PSEU|nr:hypothetical protein [Kibdelosporangium banguiense]MBP2327217.1 putative small secreted protein [Kibdelosporangium banguiense]
MIDVLATGLIYFSLGVALWALVLIVMNRPFALKERYGQALAGAVLLLVIALLVQAIAGVVKMSGAGRDIQELTFIGYLFGPVLVLPYTAFWAASERSRWGPAVLIAGCLAVPVMIVRMRQIWEGHG